MTIVVRSVYLDLKLKVMNLNVVIISVKGHNIEFNFCLSKTEAINLFKKC